MYTGVIFAKQPSNVWESVFRTPLLCFLLSPTSHWEKVQNSTFVSIVDYWIMSTKNNRSKRRIAHVVHIRAMPVCVCWWPVDNGFEFQVRVHSEAGFNLIFFMVFFLYFFSCTLLTIFFLYFSQIFFSSFNFIFF